MAQRMAGTAAAVRLTYIVSHPIQYQAPLLQRIAGEADIRLRVVFENGAATRDPYDPGFQREVRWDIKLTEGYDNIDLAATSLGREIRRADVLWLHGWQSSTLRRAIVLARRDRTPVLMRGENCDLAMPDGRGLRRIAKRVYVAAIFRGCSAFLTIGSENAQYYLGRGVPKERLFFTPYAVDNDRFMAAAAAARPDRARLKATMGLAADRPVILYVGKQARRKRTDLLVRAFLEADFGGADPALVFVGGGEMEGTLRGLAPDAVFAGFRNQSELPAFYDMADLLVLPSEREPWGLVVNEAMACATAVITSDRVGCAKDLVSADCGAVFPHGDRAALAAALARCLRHSGAMGRAARDAIRKWSFEEDLRGLRRAIDYVTGRAGNA